MFFVKYKWLESPAFAPGERIQDIDNEADDEIEMYHSYGSI